MGMKEKTPLFFSWSLQIVKCQFFCDEWVRATHLYLPWMRVCLYDRREKGKRDELCGWMFQELHTVILRELKDMKTKDNFTLNVTHFLGNKLAQKCKVEATHVYLVSGWTGWPIQSEPGQAPSCLDLLICQPSGQSWSNWSRLCVVPRHVFFSSSREVWPTPYGGHRVLSMWGEGFKAFRRPGLKLCQASECSVVVKASHRNIPKFKDLGNRLYFDNRACVVSFLRARDTKQGILIGTIFTT